MMTYYPMAITDKGIQFKTSFGFSSAEEAFSQFTIWEYVHGIRLQCAWIDVYESGKKIKKLSVAQKWVIVSEDSIT